MKSLATWIAILFFSLLIQAVFLAGIFGVGAKPDLLLVITISAGLLGGREMGLGIGFFTGLIQDLASGNIFGLNTISKMFVGYTSGFMESKVFKEGFWLPVFSAAVATLLNELIILVFLYVFGYQQDYWRFFGNQLLLKVAYNLIISLPVYRVVYRLAFR